MLNNYVYAFLLLVIGFLTAKLIAKAGIGWLESKFEIKNSVIASRLLFYAILSLFVVMSLRQLGFELGVLLGAAGILSVAVGFASKTSMSNIISGLFLLGEGTISVGDTIKVGNTFGEVISIDWLAIKLRTFDNLLVRLPNETLINSEMTNLSRFQIRRFDLYISIAYKEDFAKVKALVLELIREDNKCLIDPEPLVLLDSFGDSGVNLRFAIWAKSEEFILFKSHINERVKDLFDRQGIEIPFPHLSIYAGEATKAFPIEMRETKS